MFSLKSKWTPLLGGLFLMAIPLAAQDSQAMLDILVRKGVLTVDEAATVKSEAKEGRPTYVIPGKKAINKLSLSARVQAQYAGISTDIDGTANDPVSTNHLFLRRIYLTTKANLGTAWSMNITYDLANQSFDKAVVTYKGDWLTVDTGLRKAPLGYEELSSSGSLKAIERSGVTRYFVEPNNGRRLGASSYRIGVFAEGKSGGFVYGVAITNPERVGDATSAGNADNNQPAYWAHAAFEGEHSKGSYAFGAAVGALPDQGGQTLGAGDDLTIYSVYGDVSFGNFQLAGEYLTANVDNGATATQDASPSGYWFQSSYRFNEAFEGVARFSSLDTDGRGVKLSDGVRSAPSGGTYDKLTEYFVGGIWYIIGNELKLQAGYVHGINKDSIGGGPGKATASGIRSQLQLSF